MAAHPRRFAHDLRMAEDAKRNLWLELGLSLELDMELHQEREPNMELEMELELEAEEESNEVCTYGSALSGSVNGSRPVEGHHTSRKSLSPAVTHD